MSWLLFTLFLSIEEFSMQQHFADDALSTAAIVQSVFCHSSIANAYDAIVSKYFHIIYDETSDHKQHLHDVREVRTTIMFKFSIQ